MISISLCMIVKNEEEVLARCLESIKEVVDEIIIVDTGSTDGTKGIAAAYTSHLETFEWQDDFAAARNYSFSKATKDYIMWLDADDIVKPREKKALLTLKETLNPAVDVVLMKYELTQIGGERVVATLDRERLVKREKQFKWMNPVHEYIAYKGRSIKTDIVITHKKMQQPTRRNLDIFEKYLATGHTLAGRNLFYYARELMMWGEGDQAANYYNQFLKTTGEATSKYLDSCVALSAYYESKGEDLESLRSLLQFFEKAGPRAEICCKIGYYFKDRGEYEKAISWFSIAPHTPQTQEMGKIMDDYWHYVPYMELCACHYKLGRIKEAIYYNEEAASYAPDDEKVLYNRCFLGTIEWQRYQQQIVKEE